MLQFVPIQFTPIKQKSSVVKKKQAKRKNNVVCRVIESRLFKYLLNNIINFSMIYIKNTKSLNQKETHFSEKYFYLF